MKIVTSTQEYEDLKQAQERIKELEQEIKGLKANWESFEDENVIRIYMQQGPYKRGVCTNTIYGILAKDKLFANHFVRYWRLREKYRSKHIDSKDESPKEKSIKERVKRLLNIK